MGLFSSRREKREAAEAEIVRLGALSRPDLAAEVMQAVWGGKEGAPRPDDPLGSIEILHALAGAAPMRVVGETRRLVEGALRSLVDAGLLVEESATAGGDRGSGRWRPTPAGQTALDQGTVASAVAP